MTFPPIVIEPAALLQSASQKLVKTANTFDKTLKSRTKTVIYQVQARQYASMTAKVTRPVSAFSSEMSDFCLSSSVLSDFLRVGTSTSATTESS